jgi:hypothetical protein
MVNVLARDIFLNALLVFMALVVILLLLINPTKQADEPPPGSLSVYISWPEGPTDVDVWTLAPGEPSPVGFTTKTGQLLSLLRDDLGTANDPMPANFEHVYSRGLPAGEYVINAHCYHCKAVPVEVMVEVRVARPGFDSVRIFSAKVTLRRNREEVTAVRFRLDGDGRLVQGSMHSVFKPLFAARHPEP